MNRDYDHIKEIFDSDGIKAPDSLSEEKILAMLPDQDEESGADIKTFTPVTAAGSPKKKPKLKYVVAAACAVIALIGINPLINAITGSSDADLTSEELRTFKSYEEIEELVKSLDRSSEVRLYSNDKGGSAVEDIEYEAQEDAVMADGGSEMVDLDDSPTPMASLEGGNSGADIPDTDTPLASAPDEDHSSTYLQVEEVDEADIVKTDGKYIYYVKDTREVVILSANKGKTKKLATIGNTGVENYIHDIFLKGDTLVTIGVTYDDDEGSTSIVTYDISDRSEPEMINVFRQSGDIVSSRMVGDYVYLVTTEYVYSGERVIPMCTSGGKYDKIPVSDICCIPKPQEPSYVILSAVDIAGGKSAKSRSKAVFGASENIYCNDHNLYTAVTDWNFDNENSGIRTSVLRASLDGLDINFNAAASVRGYIDNQFSMNEKDGYFFIATTSQRDDMDVNNLFVLDNDLKEAGSVTGFARNESIKSVRFIGDKAYVITYEAIDPLFIIDLSDPADPKIEGEVKIDGFSTLLVPISSGRLLGIGYATGDNGYGGEYASGLKLALFDISDPSEPKVLASKEFENMDSPAQETHLALTVNKNDGWFAIPYSIFNADIEDDLIIDDEEPIDGEADEEEIADEDVMAGDYDVDLGYENGVLVFEAGDKIKVLDQHKLANEYLHRCVYIGDYIYALDGEGNTYSFKVK